VVIRVMKSRCVSPVPRCGEPKAFVEKLRADVCQQESSMLEIDFSIRKHSRLHAPFGMPDFTTRRRFGSPAQRQNIANDSEGVLPRYVMLEVSDGCGA